MLGFLRTNARWIFGGFLLTMFSSFGQTFFIGLSGGELRAAFDLSDGEFGLLYMGATLASAATLPWLGRTLDIMPGGRVVLFVIPCLAGACVLLSISQTIVLTALALYLLRLFGQGMMTHTALTETGRWFAANRGRATSLVVPGHQAGEMVFPPLFVALAALIGWRSVWLGAAALLVLVVLPVVAKLLSVERDPSCDIEPAVRSGRDWTRAEVLRDPIFYALLVGVLAPPFIGTTVFFHQDYLVELRGYSEIAFASAFPLMAATTVLFALVCGALIDRFGAVKLLPVFLLPLAVASAAVGLLEPIWGIYLFMTLVGVSYGFTSTLLGALWPEVYGVRYLGSVRAVIVAAMVFSTALGPGLTGALIDAGIELPVQMLVMSGWCVAAALVLAAAAPRILARNAAMRG